MINRRLVGLVAGASLLCTGIAFADNADFDPGDGGAVSTMQAQAKEAAAQPRPQMAFKTYSVSADKRVHAKGFRKHTGGKRDWKSSKDMENAFHATEAIPDTYDLRPQLTQIEDQGQCGGCWAFSLTATDRDGHAIDGNDPGRLSQEWLIEHAKGQDGCNGGDFDAADTLVSHGEPLWDSCQFDAGTGKCSARLKGADGSKITAWHMLGDQTNGPSVLDIETEMTSSGKPVSIAIAAGAGDWEKYSGGIYNGCTMAQPDHMINIVGWDNQGATFDANGNLPPGKGVWILRNSWGTSWGESGYMQTQMTDASGQRCNNVAVEAAYFDFN